MRQIGDPPVRTSPGCQIIPAHPLNLQVAWPLNDMQSVRFAHSSRAVGADLIAQPCEIGVQWSADGATWTENGDGRFLIRREGDQLGPQWLSYGSRARGTVHLPGTGRCGDDQ